MSGFINKLPNYITLLRLILIPIFVVLMIEPTPVALNAAIIIFIIASLTDYIDGLLARRFNAVSDFGKLMDPVADKILVMSALVMLVAQRGGPFQSPYGDPWVSGWLVVLILARETWVTGLRAVAAREGVVVAAGFAGKVKSFLQMIAIIFLLWHHRKVFSIDELRVTGEWIGERLLLVSVVLSYWGALEYSLAVFGSQKVKSNASV